MTGRFQIPMLKTARLVLRGPQDSDAAPLGRFMVSPRSTWICGPYPEKDAPAFAWAVEFDEWVKKRLEEGNSAALMSDFHYSEAGKLSVPTMDHYLPLFYVLGAAGKKDQLRFEFEGIQNGSASMRSFSLSS